MKIGMLEIPETCLYAARAHMLDVRQFSMMDIVRLVQTPYRAGRTVPQRDWLRKQIAAQLLNELMDEGSVVRVEPTAAVEYFRHVLADPKPALSHSARQNARLRWAYRPKRTF